MASSDASAFGRKGVAYRVTFPILDADGDLVTGATGLDSEVSKDGGTFADCTNEATEIATSSGVYYLDLTSTEMNADTVAVIVKTTSSGAKTTTLVIYPLKDGDIIANMTQVGGQTASASGTVTFPAATLASTTNITAASGVTLESSQTFSTTGSVGSVTGAVGSVTGNVGGNVAGSVGSVTGNVGGNVVGSVASVTAAVTVGTNNDKTGYTLTQAFPTNFASLGINSSGHISRVTLVDTTTTNTDMRGTDGAALASAWTSTRADYLDSVLLAVNNNRTVQVTGSHRVAADMHESQPGSIHATTFEAGAIDAAALAADAANEIAGAVLTTAMTESYRATNAAPTLAQAAFELIAHMGEASISGTTKTLKKIDGTTAKTFTLDSSTTPTSITETT